MIGILYGIQIRRAEWMAGVEGWSRRGEWDEMRERIGLCGVVRGGWRWVGGRVVWWW